MKILVYGLHFKPDLIGIGKYTGEMADWLSDNTHDIRVITAPHFYPEWGKNKKSFWYKKDINPYITWRCPIYVPAQPRGINRIFHNLSFALSSLPILIKNIFWKPDVVLSIEPPIVTAPLTLLYAMLTKAKSILHVQDLEIDAAYSLNILKKGIFYKIVKRTELFILKRFDVISTISLKMKEEIQRKGVSEDNIYILPNWADTELINPMTDNQYLRQRFSITDEQKIILYSGNIGEKQNLEIVVNVAEKMLKSKEKYIFLFVGDGASKKRLEMIADKRNITNIIFLPLQSNADFGALLTLADIHLVPQDKNISDYVLPSKLTNILSAGGVSIIFASTGTQLDNIVKEYKIGYVINPKSETEIYSAINHLLEDTKTYNDISKNARIYAEKYLSKDKILSKFEDSILS